MTHWDVLKHSSGASSAFNGGELRILRSSIPNRRHSNDCLKLENPTALAYALPPTETTEGQPSRNWRLCFVYEPGTCQGGLVSR
nr:unnamed protein product [Spirometra erinaceieuropaei]